MKHWQSIAILSLLTPALVNADITGEANFEWRQFVHAPSQPVQHKSQGSLSMNVEYRNEWNRGKDGIIANVFYRADGSDEERSHFDIREAVYFTANKSTEWRLGVGKIFWGAVETVHLVDIINQTDAVEAPDGEDKLGQPMVNFTWQTSVGTFDFFALPGFRERTFPGIEGRLRPALSVHTNDSTYESDAKRTRVDGAIRWSKSVGEWEIGLAHFSGTSREPTFNLGTQNQNGAVIPVLVPHYDVIDQTSLDVTGIVNEDILIKLEAFSRSGFGQDDRYTAIVGGIEYTFYDIFSWGTDFGFIAEYAYDERGDQASSFFQDDAFVGGRFALNDEQSTEILIAYGQDLDNQGKSYSIEASRRLGNDWKLSLEGRWFSDIPASDAVLKQISNDDYIQLDLTRFF